MASRERQHHDDAGRVLIRPSTCSTFVVKKSTVGHVPYEPSKGAVGRDAYYPAVSAGTSTAAHGGQRITARTNESKQQHSLPPRHSDYGCDVVPRVVEKDVVQLSLPTEKQVSAVTVNSVGMSAVEDYKAGSAHMSRADVVQTLKPVSVRELSSTITLSDLVEDNASTGFFPSTSLNCAVTANTENSASTSKNVQMLETEMVSLKEQLIVQSKVCL